MYRSATLSGLALLVCITLPVKGGLLDDLIALGIQKKGDRRAQHSPEAVTLQACASVTTVTGTSGEIVSPGLSTGSGYPAGTDCSWVIRTADSKRLKLTMALVDVDCNTGEYLDAIDTGASTELLGTKICNDNDADNLPIYSYTNQMTVRFTAYVQGQSKFRITYTTVSEPECGVQFERPRYTAEEATTVTTTPRYPLIGSPMGGLGGDNPMGGLGGDNPTLGIVGGSESVPHSWPWIITLTFWELHMCGAVIISDRWAVTAAHCVDSMWLPEDLTVEVGRHVSSWMEEGRPPLVQLIPIKSFIVHEHYSSITFENDIALLELNESISYNEHVQPICLSREDPVPGHRCVIAGWGVTQGTADESVLNQAIVPIVDSAVCNQAEWYDNRLFDDVQFCAGYEEGGIDTCTGDSGGPLMCMSSEGTWELDGLTSWGDGCGEPKKPGVYTRVARFIDWIHENSNGHVEI